MQRNQETTDLQFIPSAVRGSQLQSIYMVRTKQKLNFICEKKGIKTHQVRSNKMTTSV